VTATDPSATGTSDDVGRTVTVTDPGATGTSDDVGRTVTVTDPGATGTLDNAGRTVTITDPGTSSTASADSRTANVALLVQFMASTFVTDGGGHGETPLVDPATTQQPLLAPPHA
jgi:hypothetical protein